MKKPFLKPCKHTVEYARFENTPESEKYLKKINNGNKRDLQNFIQSLREPVILTYEELTPEEKKIEDELWNEHRPNSCSETCGTTN